MTPSVPADCIVRLASRVHEAAHAGTPLTKTAAETLLRAAGLSRADARRVLDAGGHGYWTEARGPTSTQGGRPPTVLLPVVPAPNDRVSADGVDPAREGVENRARAWLLDGARTLGFQRCEFRPGQVIPEGERYWRRFVTIAPIDDIMMALVALGIGSPEGVWR